MKDPRVSSSPRETAHSAGRHLRALSALALAACLFSCVSLPPGEASPESPAPARLAGEKAKGASGNGAMPLEFEYSLPALSPSREKSLGLSLPRPELSGFADSSGMPRLELAADDLGPRRLPAPDMIRETREVFQYEGGDSMGFASRASLGIGISRLPIPEAPAKTAAASAMDKGKYAPGEGADKKGETAVKPASSAAQETVKSEASKPETTAKPAEKKIVESAKTDTAKSDAAKARTEGAASAQAQKPATATAERQIDIPPILPSSTKIYPEKILAEENASRTVQAFIGRRLEIPFSGTSWTYLGEVRSLEGMSYENRRFEGGNAIFVFTPTKLGEFELLFHRQDFIQDKTLRETVKVLVTSPLAADEKPAAPALAKESQAKTDSKVAVSSGADSSAKELSAKAGEAQAAAPQESTGQAKQAKLPDTPSGLLALAKADIEAKKSQEAIDLLNRYVELYPNGSDEALILLARLYESNGAWKNIKKSYEFYKRLRNEHPESSYWSEAERRMGYIERHYLDIR